MAEKGTSDPKDPLGASSLGGYADNWRLTTGGTMIETAQEPERTQKPPAQKPQAQKSQTQKSETTQNLETATQDGFSPVGTHERADSESHVAPRNPGWMDSRSRDDADVRPADWSDDDRDHARPSPVSTDETGENLSVVMSDGDVDLELIDALKGMYFFG